MSLSKSTKVTGLSMLALLIGLQLTPIAGPIEIKAAKTKGSALPNATWLKWAGNAWRYYGVSEGLGVNSTTGLPLAALIYIYFTFWDLGTYLYAIMDASRLGLLVKAGTWGSDDRVNRVVNWLQICQRTSNNLPYLWYNSETGNAATELSSEETNVSDYGQFLIAMYRLKTFRPDLAATVDNIVNVRFNTANLAGRPEFGGIYGWYVAHGYKYFGYDSYTPVHDALGNLNQMMNGPKVTTYGITLPKNWLTSEPLQLGMFFVESDPQLTELTRNVYLAQEKRHDATGKWEAWTEGSTALPNPTYIYEWIVAGDATWVITPSPITPIAYMRTAVAYQALFDTSYTLSMVDYLNTTLGGPTVGGYGDGVDQNGRLVPTLVDRTNGIIMAAARFIHQRTWSMLDGPTPDALASASSSSRLYVAARGMENGIWYRSMDGLGSWSMWVQVPGFTDVRPAVAVFNNRLYFFCKQQGANSIWYGYYPLTDGAVSGAFSGWTLLDGPTPSAVSLAASPDYLYVAARGMDGSIWHRRMSTGEAWSAWFQIPGYTDVAPAITIFKSGLCFACKQSGAFTIWYSNVTISTYPSGWSGWSRLDGPTPDAASLTTSSNYLYLAARGTDDGIWYRTMDLSGVWSAWTGSLGSTDVSPAITTAIFDGNQYLVCKQKGSTTIWYRVA